MNGTPRKLYQRIAEEIAAAIRDGRYAAGSRLPGERDLAEEFAVSRPTVREAMIALEMRGLVEARQGSGIYVTNAENGATPLPELDVGAFELIEARVLFEGEAAALAATSIEEDVLIQLESLLGEMEGQTDTASALQADRKFHLLIAEATGNTLVRSTIEMLWRVREQSPLCIHMFAQAQREGVTPRAAEHRLILDALRARDPQRARDAMRSHLRRVADDLLSATELELIKKAHAEANARRARMVLRARA